MKSREIAAALYGTTGAVFLLSAVLKTLSFGHFAVQVSYYGVVREPALVLATASAVIGLETFLGVCLILPGISGRWLSGASFIVLAAFTGLVAYAWAYRNLTDCGCFGKYLKSTPGWSAAFAASPPLLGPPPPIPPPFPQHPALFLLAAHQRICSPETPQATRRENPMNIGLTLSFHGAARSTTGSRHLLHVGDRQILLDCGLYQGPRKKTYEHNLHFSFPPPSIHAVVLSHAHIDHSGNLPNLVRQHFDGPIFSTPATADLCRIMLRDSAYLQERDAEWLTRHTAKHGKPRSVAPIYTLEDAEASLALFQTVPYYRPFDVIPGVRATFTDAGHILGSASPILQIQRGATPYRLAFSGDIGRKGLPLLRDPEPPANIDWLIMEGTYGARTHDSIAEAKTELLQTIQRIQQRNGKIVIPSFSVERTQEILYYLNELYNEQQLPPIPIYVDSPLAIKATEIFRLHPDCYNKAARETLLFDSDLFGFERVTFTRSVKESMALNDHKGPCVIISASGMCEGGRIVHHLRNSIGDPRNCILFVGYQAEGTLGRKIVERQEVVNILGEPNVLRAEVVTLNTFSGHADKNDLFDYARRVRDASPRLRKVFIVHGEETGLQAIAQRIENELQLDVAIPSLGDTWPLEG